MVVLLALICGSFTLCSFVSLFECWVILRSLYNLNQFSLELV